MQLDTRNLHREVLDKAKLNIHLIMGYIFLSLVFAGAVSSVYYWEYKAKLDTSHNVIGPKQVESGEQAGQVNNGSVCAQVITTARNKETGEVRDFASPCAVTGGWEILAQ